MRDTMEKARRVAHAISKLDLPLSQLILFGSVARGCDKITSDIDIAVITHVPLSNSQRKEVTHTVAEYETLDSIQEVNCFYATDEALAKATHWNDPCTNIRKDGVVLWQHEVI